MSSLNKVILIGHLGQNPEVRESSKGGEPQKIVTLSLATTESWSDKRTGEKKSMTEWHRIVIFNQNLASVAERFLKKGSKAYIEGQLQTRKWSDKQGVERYTTEVVLPAFRGTIILLGDPQHSQTSAPAAQPAAHPAQPASDPFAQDIPW